jgi:hypothetical protein
VTPESIYGPHVAKRIELIDECWVWTGVTRYSGGNLVPYHDSTRVVSALPNSSRVTVTTCRDPLCVHPDHVVDTYSEPGRMVFIREHVVWRAGGCQEWLGNVKKVQKGQSKPIPVLYLKGTGKKPLYTTTVRRFNFCVEYVPVSEPWPDGIYGVTCGNDLCVAPEHIAPPKVKEPVVSNQDSNSWMSSLPRRNQSTIAFVR